MILDAAATAIYQTSEFWTAVQAFAALASCVAAFGAIRAANKSHRESGPMISITMNPYLYAPKNGRSESRTELSGSYEVCRIGVPQIELVLLTITNSGRTAATVNGVYLKIAGEGLAPNLRQSAREIEGTGRIETVSFNEGPVVVEPYSEKRVLVDFWGRLHKIFEDNPKLRRVTVSGAVDVVGVRNTIVTAKHGQWFVDRNHRSFSGDHFKVRPIDVMATELMWQFKSLTVVDQLVVQMQSAERQLQPDYRFTDVGSALNPWPENKHGLLSDESAIIDINTAAIKIQGRIQQLRKAGFLLDPPEKLETVTSEEA